MHAFHYATILMQLILLICTLANTVVYFTQKHFNGNFCFFFFEDDLNFYKKNPAATKIQQRVSNTHSFPTFHLKLYS
jgi:hypothetical protein